MRARPPVPLTAFLLALGVAGTPAMTNGAAAQVQVRLLTPVSSATSMPGDSVRAVTIAPLMLGSRMLATPGCELPGRVLEGKHEKGIVTRHTVSLEFPQLVDASQVSHPLKTFLIEVDNARETVDQDGRILGMEPPKMKPDSPEDALMIAATGNPFVLGEALFAKITRRDMYPAIDYEVGTELMLRLRETWSGPRLTCGPLTAEMANNANLARLVNAQPLRTTAKSSPKPADVTNLMFLGTREALVAAFAKAGWSTADASGVTSSVKTFLAIAAGQGYKEGPVSLLLLEGKPPDLVYQKQLNTFAKRHHIRIWQREGTYLGQPVWVGAATHDTGIVISKVTKWFTHSIDSNLDDERAKIVNDLAFAGAVNDVLFVERPDAPRSDENATGDKISTDGRMAVLAMK